MLARLAVLGRGGPCPSRKDPRGWRRVLYYADWGLWWTKWAADYMALSAPFCVVVSHFLHTTTVNS